MKKKNLLQRLLDLLPFRSKIESAVSGGKNLSISEAQILLVRLGYLKKPYQLGQMDEPTRTALAIFQQFYRLALISGELTIETVKVLTSSRCGNADLTEIARSALEALAPPIIADAVASPIMVEAVAPLALVPDLSRGCSYHDVSTLTYTISDPPTRGGVSRLSMDEVKREIGAAFQTWANAIPIDFILDETNTNATFKLKWARDDHGDGSENILDNSVSLYAHAFYPPDCHEGFPGQCHFNDHLIWALDDDPDREAHDLQSVALHEIGHLLGLKHSNDQNSIMIPGYKGKRRKLTADALASIQRIYGMRNLPNPD